MPDPRTLQPHTSLRPQHRLRRHLLRLAGALLSTQNKSQITNHALRILLIRPDHLGDVILATPAFAALRAALPQAHITALVGPWAEVIARRSPHLDEVLTLPFPGFARRPTTEVVTTKVIEPYRLAWREAQRLRAYRFDVAVVLRFDHWWGALLTALAGIPLRIGYDLPDVAPFLSHALPHATDTHVTQQNLVLIDTFTNSDLSPVGDFPGSRFTIKAAALRHPSLVTLGRRRPSSALPRPRLRRPGHGSRRGASARMSASLGCIRARAPMSNAGRQRAGPGSRMNWRQTATVSS